jgi:tRNA threonylcarbamoyladenosine biosynthesis protein TsaB
MLILALDTTTRAGSLALVRDDVLLETFVGDDARTHATRLPGDVLDCLSRHGHVVADVDLYGVAAGPGSFTGLRIGIATVQGLAFANARPVAAVSALDALADATVVGRPGACPARLRAAWMDARRGEVYAALYRRVAARWEAIATPIVQKPEAVLAAWARDVAGQALTFVGDGASSYAAVIEAAHGPAATIVSPVPPLAPAIARLALAEARAGRAGHPHAIRPVYIRRPDAELARDRRAGVVR